MCLRGKNVSKLQHDIWLRIVKLLDIVGITLPFAGCWILYYAEFVHISPTWPKHAFVLIFFMVLYIVVGKIYDAFLISIQRVSELVYSQILAALVADGAMYILICLLSEKLCSLWPGIVVAIGQLIVACIWSVFAHWWYYRTFTPQRTAVVYDVRQGIENLIDAYDLNLKYDVKLVVPVQQCIENIENLSTVETVFLSGVHSQDRNTILKYCIANDINVFVIPCLGDIIMSGARPMHMFHLPMLRVGQYMTSPEYLMIKRIADVLLSLVGLFITSPIFLITAIGIKAIDGGPIFYKQVRLTKNGKKFQIIKFRSMRVDAEKDGVARLSTGDKDSRVTPIGRIIRKYRIDELPQLINILKGDLSICGPRPERPEIAMQYCEQMPEFVLRLQAKAGLTGYAQVYGKYNTTPYDKLQMDLMYIAHPSIIEDLKIILATVKVLFVAESTDGIAEGSITAMENNNQNDSTTVV